MPRRTAAVALVAALGVVACHGGGGGATTTTTTTTTTATSAAATTTTVPVATSGLQPGDLELVAAPVRSPVADEVVYFVLPDRFDDGDPTNDRGGVAGDDPLVTGYLPSNKGYYHGGDLAGLRRRLDYLQGLGVTAIWITPPFTNRWVQGDGTVAGSSAGYHGYWQTDLTTIDPHLGTNDDMKAFVDDVHRRGMKVYVDIVANHTGDVITYPGGASAYVSKDVAPYKDAAGQVFDDHAVAGTSAFPTLAASTSFPYVPTFASSADATVKAPAFLNDPTNYHNRGNSTFTGESAQYGDFYGLDDLFTEKPAVVQGLIDAYGSVIDTFGVDGFRVDTVKHVNDEFWQAFVPAMLQRAKDKGIDDFAIFGEVFDQQPGFLSHYSTALPFPGTLDFRFDKAVRDLVAGSKAPARFTQLLSDDDWFTDTDSNAFGLVTFAGNHDIGRLGWSIEQENATASDTELLARDRLAQVLLFTSRGAPVVYYGDEQGLTGDGKDQDARQDLFGSQVPSYLDDHLIGTDATLAQPRFDTGHPLYQTISQLARLRRQEVALWRGAQVPRAATDDGLLAYSRIDRDEQAEVLVAVNVGTQPATATFATDTPGATFVPLTPSTAPSVASDASGTVTVSLPALSSVVLKADRKVATDHVADAVTVRVRPTVSGRAAVDADVAGGAHHEVTFAVSVDGGPFQVLGVDDAAPYGVRHDVSGLAPGTPLVYRAIAVDAGGNVSAASATSAVAPKR